MTQRFRPPWREGSGPVPRYVVRPTERFLRVEAAGGFALVAAAVVALVWANVHGDSYGDFWGTRLTADLALVTLDKQFVAWVNDALMVVFFFVVGMEIKREFVTGELSDYREAILPAAGAIGGMVTPVVIFLVFNLGHEGVDGWGIPVATDIAFALGVLALLGSRVPLSLQVFLLALAVFDDIGGILIIAVFYTGQIEPGWLVAAAGLLLVIVAMNRSGMRSVPAYVVVGVAFWLCTFNSGVHATIAGVALGLLTPAAALYDPQQLPNALRGRVDALESALLLDDPLARGGLATEAVREIEEYAREALSPLDRIEHFLTPWSAFVVLPIFALANAGIDLNLDDIRAATESRVALGVGVGLVAGKILGIMGASAITILLGVAKPAGSWLQLLGISALAGIGFTVAIFIATVAYDDPQLAQEAKIGILVASGVAAVLGYTVLRVSGRTT
jgi:NhaA family Na+:H+ antiporter